MTEIPWWLLVVLIVGSVGGITYMIEKQIDMWSKDK